MNSVDLENCELEHGITDKFSIIFLLGIRILLWRVSTCCFFTHSFQHTSKFFFFYNKLGKRE